VGEFGRTIALWEFNAVEQFMADFGTDSFESVLTAVAVMCTSQLSCQIVLRFQLPAKRGLVQIAESFSETRSISVNLESRSSPADSTRASFWRGKDMLYFPAKICFNPQLKP
jgi:hypothetical protein